MINFRLANYRDLLLPVGAALVTAGVEYLADRERATRARLAELEQAVTERRAELGLLAPDADEPPAEPEPIGNQPNWLSRFGTGAAAPELVDEQRPRPRWKVAAAVVAAVGGITAVRLGPALLERIGAHRAFLAAGPVDEQAADYAAAAFRGEVDPPEPYVSKYPAHTHTYAGPDDCTNPTCPVCGADRVAAAELVDDGGADYAGGIGLGACGWPGCPYVSDLKDPQSRATALVVHRNTCDYRPANLHVPE